MPTDWVAVCHERGYVWDIGQLEPADKRALDKAVKAGALIKERGHWCNLAPLHTCWVSRAFLLFRKRGF
jgi:hypothetical protein